MTTRTIDEHMRDLGVSGKGAYAAIAARDEEVRHGEVRDDVCLRCGLSCVPPEHHEWIGGHDCIAALKVLVMTNDTAAHAEGRAEGLREATEVCEAHVSELEQSSADEHIAVLTATEDARRIRALTAPATPPASPTSLTGHREECTLDNCGHMRQLDAIVDLIGMTRGTRSVLDELRARKRQEEEDAALPWGDKQDEWSRRIHDAFPTNSGSHDTYGVAMKMVGNRHSKGALVALVNWLLLEKKGRT
jgi:hypothetical protein